MLEREVFDSKVVTYNGGGHCDSWLINPYRYCDLRCAYCITGAQGSSVPTYDKDRTLEAIEKALQSIPDERRIMVGGFSDPYPHTEQQYGITRHILHLLNQQHPKYTIITKGLLVDRDIDLIKDNPDCKVVFSFSTLDDSLSRHLESSVPLPSARLELLHRFVAQGVDVTVSMAPWIPGMTDIREFLARTPSHVPIHTDRLKIVRASRTFSILGKVYTQREIDRLFLGEKRKYQRQKRIHWHIDARYSEENETEVHPIAAMLSNPEDAYHTALERGSRVHSSAEPPRGLLARPSFQQLKARVVKLLEVQG